MNICARDKGMVRKVGRSAFGNIRKIWVGCFLVCVYAFAPVQSANTKIHTSHTSIRIKTVLQCLYLTKKNCALTSLPADKKTNHREREKHFILLYSTSTWIVMLHKLVTL